MRIAVIANNDQKKELLTQGIVPGADIIWIDQPALAKDAGCIIDLLYNSGEERINSLKDTNVSIIIINEVCHPLRELPANFIRINGWPTFLKRGIMEASTANEVIKPDVEKIFSFFGKTVSWVPDVPGFVAARIISMIINEAYFTLEEKVSTKEEIDIAMKLGTNYPYGPFEWSQKIGLEKIYSLLEIMGRENNRYSPANLLTKEASII
jgi:3-hydroxybutyryl-CoA dehydrogenase